MRRAALLLLLSSLLSSAYARECVFLGGDDLGQASAWSSNSLPLVKDTATFKNLKNLEFFGQNLNVAKVKLINSTVFLRKGTHFVSADTTVDHCSTLSVVSQSVLSCDRLFNFGSLSVESATIDSRIIEHKGSDKGSGFVIYHKSKISGDRLTVFSGALLTLSAFSRSYYVTKTTMMLYIDILCEGEINVRRTGEIRGNCPVDIAGPFEVLSDRQHNIQMQYGSVWSNDASVEMKDFNFIAEDADIQIGLCENQFTFSSINIQDCKITSTYYGYISNPTFNLTGSGPSYIRSVKLTNEDTRPNIVANNHMFNMGDWGESWEQLLCTNCTINSTSKTRFDDVIIKDSELTGNGTIYAKITATGTTTLSGNPNLDCKEISTMEIMFVDAGANVTMSRKQMTVNKITGTGSITSKLLYYKAAEATTETWDLSNVNIDSLGLNYMTKIVFSSNQIVRIGMVSILLENATTYSNYNNTVILSAPNGNVQVNKAGVMDDLAACFAPVGVNKGETFELTIPTPSIDVAVALMDGGMSGGKRIISLSIATLPSCFTLDQWVLTQDGGPQVTHKSISLKENITLDNTDRCSILNMTATAIIKLAGTVETVRNKAAAGILITVPTEFRKFAPSFDQLSITHDEGKYTVSWPKSLVTDSVVCGVQPSKISFNDQRYDITKGSTIIYQQKCLEIDLRLQLVWAYEHEQYTSSVTRQTLYWSNDPTPSSEPTVDIQKLHYYDSDSYRVTLKFPYDASCDCGITPVISVKQTNDKYYYDINYYSEFTSEVYQVPANLTYTYHTKCGYQKNFSEERSVNVYIPAPTFTIAPTSSVDSSIGVRCAFSMLLVSTIMLLF